MAPQSGLGGEIPKPKKLIPAADTIVFPTARVELTINGPIAFGRR